MQNLYNYSLVTSAVSTIRKATTGLKYVISKFIVHICTTASPDGVQNLRSFRIDPSLLNVILLETLSYYTMDELNLQKNDPRISSKVRLY